MSDAPLTFLQRLTHIFFNKYVFVFSVFAVIIVFFDPHNVISRVDTGLKINQLEKDKLYYQKEINENKQKINDLQSSDENLEKFAREQYLMKKDNEDIFIIKE
jgi:cell division protein FtsB